MNLNAKQNHDSIDQTPRLRSYLIRYANVMTGIAFSEFLFVALRQVWKENLRQATDEGILLPMFLLGATLGMLNGLFARLCRKKPASEEYETTPGRFDIVTVLLTIILFTVATMIVIVLIFGA